MSDGAESPIPWLRTALVVEDHTAVAKRVASYLRGWGAETVWTAESRIEAAAFLTASSAAFDVVLCDYFLKDGPCGELLAQLSRSARCARLVILTGHASAQQRTDLIYAFQPADIISKPFTPADLHNRLMAIDQKREEQASGWFHNLARTQGIPGATKSVQQACRDRSLKDADGNLSEAARRIGISRTDMQRAIRKRGGSGKP